MLVVISAHEADIRLDFSPLAMRIAKLGWSPPDITYYDQYLFPLSRNLLAIIRLRNISHGRSVGSVRLPSGQG